MLAILIMNKTVIAGSNIIKTNNWLQGGDKMFKIVFWRYGHRMVEEFETRAEANKQFNFIGEYELGFSECILDQDNRIIRDGKERVLGIKKEKRTGTVYEV